jgi:hypothetical protein
MLVHAQHISYIREMRKYVWTCRRMMGIECLKMLMLSDAIRLWPFHI